MFSKHGNLLIVLLLPIWKVFWQTFNNKYVFFWKRCLFRGYVAKELWEMCLGRHHECKLTLIQSNVTKSRIFEKTSIFLTTVVLSSLIVCQETAGSTRCKNKLVLDHVSNMFSVYKCNETIQPLFIRKTQSLSTLLKSWRLSIMY